MEGRERVSEFLSSSGAKYEHKELDKSTKNSVLVAQALGCSVAEIARVSCS